MCPYPRGTMDAQITIFASLSPTIRYGHQNGHTRAAEHADFDEALLTGFRSEWLFRKDHEHNRRLGASGI